jgi:hypothetical protein
MKIKMRRFFLFTLTLFVTSDFLSASVPIMPLKDIRPGMRATCKTVFQGVQVEEFELEIIEVMRNVYPQNDVLLVRLLSPKAQETGVVAGMSGSPVYIDGKLIGALAYRFGTFTKEAIGGITPIEQMLAIVEKEKIREQERQQLGAGEPFPANFSLGDWANLSEREQAFFEFFTRNSVSHPVSQGLVPLQIPISVAGVQLPGDSKFPGRFEQLGFQLISGGASSGAANSAVALVPGGAVAGVIFDGDVSLSAVGTVTHVDGNQVLAFGHPFIGSGAVSIPMASAKILATISSTYYSYKMAEVASIVGNIHQDRISGIMGVIGSPSEMFPVNVNYESPFQEKVHYRFRVASDKSLNSMIPFYLWFALSATLQSARMGSGEFSTQLTGKIALANSEDIILDNYFSSPQPGEDAGLATLDVAIFTAYLLTNSFVPARIESIDLNFKSDLGSQTAQIESIWSDKSRLKPGDDLNLYLFIRPFQKDLVKYSRRLKIPENLAPGIYTVLVGSAEYVTKFETSISPGKFIPHDFQHLVKLLNQRRKNNELTIQLRKSDLGTIIEDQEFTQLPPSVLTTMNSKKSTDRMQQLRDVVLLEHSQAVAWDLKDGQLIRIQVLSDK